ncbi:MAG: malto-oligosyltrehalose trehalohydrolase [Brachybacterium sp.]|nr:malto-oligosyltrehalose trehalohydrolase [Brachybacterium sp.]
MSSHPTPAARDYRAYEVWAPHATTVEIRLGGHGDATEQAHALAADPDGSGWFRLDGVPAVPGTRYAYRLDGDGPWLPDPRSLAQPDGVHAASEVVDPGALAALVDDDWQGKDLRGSVLYEMHVGTFTAGPDGRGGTFDSAIERLDALVDLGVDAVEVMPVAAFPGRRGWGYDGVNLYATHEAYGGPEAFARFIAAAHARGLGVVLDVVYNHLGPDGNYLAMFGPYFTDAHHTPWGSAVNLDAPGSEHVRTFILGAVRQWLVDFHLDGLRLDAVHELQDDSQTHLLAEMADAVTAMESDISRPLLLIAESDRNDPVTVTPTSRGGLGMDMQWADDIHHAVHAWVTGERAGYYVDFGSARVLARTLTRMFEHDGTFSTFRDRIWGAPVDPASTAYDGHSFVAFLQNHDQIGNRAAGDRIHASLSPGQQAAAASLILLGAATPMLFQGEEWAASTPFTYFTDHEEELGRLVTAGRTEEFAQMDWADAVPDPQADSTFTASILDWSEREQDPHTRMLTWYRTLIGLRHAEPDLADPDLRSTAVDILGEETVVLRRGTISVLAHRGEDAVEVTGALGATGEVLVAFGTEGSGEQLRLAGPGAVVVRG